MEFRISTNMMSRQAVLGFNRNWADMMSSLQKLSSGRRINSAADDPAGLVISKQLQSQIGSLNQEINNISDTINKYQAVSGTVGELRDDLSELRSLAVGAANEGFNSEEAQQAYATAADSIVRTYNRTVENAQYNGRHTLDGSAGSLALVSDLEGIDLSSPEAAVASIEKIDAAARELDEVSGDLAATQTHELESRRRSLQVTRENLIAAESTIADTDYALEIARFMSSMIRSQSSMALLAHSMLSGKNVVSLFKQ
ncbi:hypothetical protein GF377_05475 [candidate division GN15 bacterium]|nr:hypothetical protein [candidate division GN15 bacterium]